jgi:hypothetical protein
VSKTRRSGRNATVGIREVIHTSGARCRASVFVERIPDMSRRRSRRKKSSVGETLAALAFLVLVPIFAVKSCLSPSTKPASRESFGVSSIHQTTASHPTTRPSLATTTPGRAPKVTRPNVNIPNPDLPGHRPRLHVPHVRIGGGHRHHF